MAVPPDILADLRDLEGTLAGVRDSVDAAIGAGGGDRALVAAGDAVARVEVATGSWLDRTRTLEERLTAHARAEPADAGDVAGRLGAIALLHVATACDVGAIEPLDHGEPDADVRMLLPGTAWPAARSTIQATAFDAGVIADLGRPEPDDDGPSDAGALPPTGDEGPATDVDEVVREIVERAGEGASAVLFGLAGGVTDLAFGLIAPQLVAALGVAPDVVQSTVGEVAGRVAGLVRVLIGRVDDLLGAILGSYRDAVGAVIDEADPAAYVGEALAGKVVGRLLRVDGIRAEAVASLEASPADTLRRVRRMRRLLQTNRRWVGPVRYAARGLPHLWAIPIGPVPAAPIAAVGLLAWTTLVTGDHLDAPGPHPNLWKGVLRLAAGET